MKRFTLRRMFAAVALAGLLFAAVKYVNFHAAWSADIPHLELFVYVQGLYVIDGVYTAPLKWDKARRVTPAGKAEWKRLVICNYTIVSRNPE